MGVLPSSGSKKCLIYAVKHEEFHPMDQTLNLDLIKYH